MPTQCKNKMAQGSNKDMMRDLNLQMRRCHQRSISNDALGYGSLDKERTHRRMRPWPSCMCTYGRVLSMDAPPRTSIAFALETMTTISDLPPQLWDEILSYLWSWPTALGSARISLRDFGNFRLANREFWRRSQQAFVDRNIRHLRIRLNNDPSNILHGLPDVKHTAYVLGSTGLRGRRLYFHVRTIEFLHFYAKCLGRQSLCGTCLARLSRQLSEIVRGARNVTEVIWTGRRGIIMTGTSSIDVFNVALRCLFHQRFSPLQQVSFRDCEIDSPTLVAFFNRHQASITTVRMYNVWLSNGNWDTTLIVWRDRARQLTEVKLWRLHVVGVTDPLINYARFTGPDPVLPFYTRTALSDGTVYEAMEHYHLSGSLLSMKGRTGVQLGLNKLLEEHGSAGFDPALTHAALLASGRIY